MDVGGILILIESGGILGSVKLGGLFRYKVDVSRKFKLVDPGGFFRF